MHSTQLPGARVGWMTIPPRMNDQAGLSCRRGAISDSSRWLCAVLAGAFLFLPTSGGRADDANSIVITEVAGAPGEIRLVFESSCPPGTSYQPQFFRDLVDSGEGSWADIPDAHVTEIDGMSGVFRVTAPTFGGASGFYRVVDTASTQAEAPIQNTLDEEAIPPSDQVLLLWNQRRFNDMALHGKLYDFVEGDPGGEAEDSLQAFPSTTFDGDLSLGEIGVQDMVAVDFNGDGRPDPLFCWPNSDGTLQLVCVTVPDDGGAFESIMSTTVIGSTIRQDNSPRPMIRMVAAQLDDDEFPEIVLAWTGSDDHVHTVPLDFNGDPKSPPSFGTEESGTSQPFVRDGSIQDRSAGFDLIAGNFDGDENGRDEIAIVTTETITVTNGSDNWRVYVKFYTASSAALTAQAGITPSDSELYAHTNRATTWLPRIAGVAEDFDGDGRDELVVGYHVAFSSSSSLWYAQMVQPDPAFTSVSVGNRVEVDRTNGSSGYPLCILTLDIDDDPEPELFYGARVMTLIDTGPNLSISEIGTGGLGTESGDHSRRFLTFADFAAGEPDPNGFPSLVSVTDSLIDGNSMRRMSLRTYQVTGEPGNFRSINQTSSYNDELSNNTQRTFSLVAVPFSPIHLRLGVPRRYTRIMHNRPTVVLNAPPVHFDVFDGTVFDVNNLFPTIDCPPQGCPFYSRFTRSATESVTVSTNWKRSWDVSITASGGLSIGPVGLDLEVRTKFGEELETFASTTETTTVEIEIDAVDDDRIYATTVSYTIWEYPVLAGEELIGYVILTEPDVTRQNWFPSKSIVAQSYRPYHEVGNLLSYRSETVPYDNATYVREVEAADSITISATGGNSRWKLTRQTGTTTSDSRTTNFSVGATASFDVPFPFVPNVEVSGDYSSSKLESSETTVTDTEGLEVFLGILDGSIAGTTYIATPYFYWDRSGAVVLDYAIDLPTGTPQIQTFWGQRYSASPDPTFILPWRLDPEKGLALATESLRELTRDIITIPAEPRPGQTVRVIARISNFAFRGNPQSFEVKFYLGNPSNGGTLIHEASVEAGALGARKKYLLEFPWTVPSSISTVSVALYAVIDPNGTLDEIHEDNNRGWNEIFIRRDP